MDIQSLQKKLEKIIISYGNLAQKSQNTFKITRYSPNICTNVELVIEDKFINWVHRNYPEFSIVTEEQNNPITSEYTFALDAIDGSKYYINGVPLWTVTISLLYHQEPIIGLVYQPQTKMLFSASEGNGAYLNGKKIFRKIDSKNVENHQLMVDLPFGSKNYSKYSAYLSNLLNNLYQDYYRVRSFGCGSLSLCWLSMGMFSAYLYPLLRPEKYIDIAAAMLIASESGLKVQKDTNKDFPEYKTIFVSELKK